MAFSLKNKGRHRNAAMSEINVTPFVDVLLVLLIIFMVAAPMMVGNVELDLPEGSENAVNENKPPLTVSIKEDGSIYVGEELVKLALLKQKLLKASNENMQQKIYIRADIKVNYGHVMKIVKKINQAGFKQASLVTQL